MFTNVDSSIFSTSYIDGCATSLASDIDDSIPSASSFDDLDPLPSEQKRDGGCRCLGEPPTIFVRGHADMVETHDLPIARALAVVRHVFAANEGDLDDKARAIQRRLTRKVKNGVWMCKIGEAGTKFFLEIKFPTACILLERGDLAILLVKYESGKVLASDRLSYLKYLLELGREPLEHHTAKVLEEVSLRPCE